MNLKIPIQERVFFDKFFIQNFTYFYYTYTDTHTQTINDL